MREESRVPPDIMWLGSWEAALFISVQYPKAFATVSIRMINYSCCDPGDKTHMVSFCLAGRYLEAFEKREAISAKQLKKVHFVFVPHRLEDVPITYLYKTQHDYCSKWIVQSKIYSWHAFGNTGFFGGGPHVYTESLPQSHAELLVRNSKVLTERYSFHIKVFSSFLPFHSLVIQVNCIVHACINKRFEKIFRWNKLA